MKTTNLLVISDEAIARVGLGHLLASEAGFEVTGEAGGRDAIEQASKLGPDVVIVFAELTNQVVRNSSPRFAQRFLAPE